MARIQFRHAASCGLALALGCSNDEPDLPLPSEHPALAEIEGTAGPAKVGPSFDVSEIVRRSHFAFSEGPDGLVGGDDTFGSRVRDDGQIRFTPIDNLEERGSDGKAVVVNGNPLLIKTVSISRSAELKKVRPRASRAAHGGVFIEHPEVVEQIGNSAVGVRQEWVFPAAPIGSGDLIVEVEVEGQDFAGRTEGGLHFVDPDTGLGSRYGDIAWIDADGNSTALVPNYDNGRIWIRVPEGVLQLSSYPAVLDPVIGPERAIDTATSGRAAGTQTDPSISGTGTKYLVAWADARRTVETGSTEYDIYAARVDTTISDVVLDPVGIPVAIEAGDQLHPSVSGGLIVWDDRPSAGAVRQIKARGVDMVTGAVWPALAQQVNSSAAEDCASPDIAIAGGFAFVVYENISQNLIHARRLNSIDLTPLGGLIPVSGMVTGGRNPAIAAATSVNEFYMTWEEANNIKVRGFSSAGVNLSDTSIAIAETGTLERSPDIAYHDNEFVVAWIEGAVGSASAKVKARTITRPWNMMAAEATTICSVASPKSNLAMTTDPIMHRGVIAWRDERFDADGDIIGSAFTFPIAPPPTTVVSNHPTGVVLAASSGVEDVPTILSNGDSLWRVAYRSDYSHFSVGGDIFAAKFVGGTLAPVNVAYNVSKSAGRQSGSAVAFDGTNYLVAYLDNKLEGDYLPDVKATLVDPSGLILAAATPITVGSGTSYSPAVAYDGANNYYVVWHDNGSGILKIYGARVRKTDGVNLDVGAPKPVSTLATHSGGPSVAAGGGNILVVWQDYRAGFSNTDIYGVRVNPATGAVTPGTEVGIATAALNQSNPRVVFGGSNFLVVWQDAQAAQFSSIRGRLVTSSGALGAAVNVSGTPTAAQRYPSVGTSGADRFLVVWEDDRTAANGVDIYGRIVAGGVPQFSVFPVSVDSTVDELSPETAGSGGGGATDHLAVWHSRLKLGSSFTEDVKGQYITYTGGLTGAAFAIDDLPDEPGVRERTPALACNLTSHRCFVTYTKYSDADGTDRIIGATVDP